MQIKMIINNIFRLLNKTLKPKSCLINVAAAVSLRIQSLRRLIPVLRDRSSLVETDIVRWFSAEMYVNWRDLPRNQSGRSLTTGQPAGVMAAQLLVFFTYPRLESESVSGDVGQPDTAFGE